MSSVSRSGHSFDELIAPIRTQLIAYVRRLNRHVTPADADDIVQNSMLRAWRAWPNWSPAHPDSVVGCAKAWMFRIVTNAAETWRVQDRRQNSHTPPTSAAVEITANAHSATRWHVIAPTDSGWPDARPASFGQSMQTVLGRLHPDHRVIVELHFVEGLDTKTIALRLKVKHATIRTRLFRALAALEPLLHRDAVELYPLRRARIEMLEVEPTETEEPDADGVDGIVTEYDTASL